MQYRTFGKTGAEISALGFGCMRFPLRADHTVDEEQATQMLHSAIEGGVNYIDTAYHYHDGESEKVVGRALAGGWRERVYLATKAPVYSFTAEEDFDRVLEDQLNRLQTDHLDFYLLHTLSRNTWEKVVLKFHLLEKMEQAKRAGKIRHIGFSFHDEADAFVQILDGWDQWEFCQIQLNYVGGSYQAGLAGLEYAAAKGLGVIIMEPLLGGKLANPPAAVAKLLPPEKTPVEWALDYLWNRPEVSFVLSGMSSPAQVTENLVYAARSGVGMLPPAALALLEQAKVQYEKTALVPCTQCGYCMPCPAGLNIPALYEAYNKTATGTKKAAAALYRAIDGKTAESCTGCNACEHACPQHISGAELMPKLAQFFEKLR